MLAGACLGFLPHNFNPARIFMGDSGSMLIGLMLAAATTTASGQILPDADTSATDVHRAVRAAAGRSPRWSSCRCSTC